MDGGAAFCQCKAGLANENLCNGGSGGSLVCSTLDKVCVAKCTSNSDCSGSRTCDTAKGQCTTGTTDAGSVCSPVCTADQNCVNSACVDKCFPGYCSSTADTCSLTTGFCAPAAACSVANQEPDVCAYGQYCETDNKCSDVPAIPSAAACPNFAPPYAPAWNPSVDRGIVIYAVESLPGDENVNAGVNWCGAGLTSYTGKIYAYNTTGQFPATGQGAQLSGFWYVDSSGAKIDGVVGGSGGFGIFRKQSGFTASADRKTATIKFTLCSSGTAASIPAGFYFTGGNEFCASVAD